MAPVTHRRSHASFCLRADCICWRRDARRLSRHFRSGIQRVRESLPQEKTGSPASFSHQVFSEDPRRRTGLAPGIAVRLLGGLLVLGQYGLGDFGRVELQPRAKPLQAFARPALGTRDVLAQTQEKSLDLCGRQPALAFTRHVHPPIQPSGDTSPPRKSRAGMPIRHGQDKSHISSTIAAILYYSRIACGSLALQPAPTGIDSNKVYRIDSSDANSQFR